MLQYERISRVLEYINEHTSATIDEMSKKFGVSPITIRRDIDSLAERKLVIKIHGGVMSTQTKLSYEIPYLSKKTVNLKQKMSIGRCAAEMIKDNNIVVIDAGTTTLEIAKHINAKNVTVITNDIKIANEIAERELIDLIVVGGTLEKGVYTLTGFNSIEFLQKFHVNKAFLGADAIDLDFGISNRTYSEVSLKHTMRDIADEKYVVADASKFHKKLFYSTFKLNEIDTIITDYADKETIDYMNKIGKNIIITQQNECEEQEVK